MLLEQECDGPWSIWCFQRTKPETESLLQECGVMEKVLIWELEVLGLQRVYWDIGKVKTDHSV